METNTFIIIREDNHDLAARWDHKTIIFESREEAEEFTLVFPGFFAGVDCGTVPVHMDQWDNDFEYIYYKDLVNLDSYKESLEQRAN